MATRYTTTGSIRGGCAHLHRTREAAARCLARDERGCATQGGYSDRRVVEIETGYHVYYAPDGSGETYLGLADTLRDAYRLAAEHHRGEALGLEESMYGTARAAGHVAGYSAPDEPEEREPVAWFGAGGWYCAIRLVPQEVD